MRIAIIGTGISGMVAAYLLHREHEITVFEANDYIGGHTDTHEIDVEGRTYNVDTGFIVCNDRTYPAFLCLMEHLGVELQATEMSFSVRCDRTGLEYNGHNLDTLFAQRSNLLKPGFYRMLADILRFNRDAQRRLEDGTLPATLGELAAEGRYGERLWQHYLVPMGAAIWSSSLARMREFPAPLFVRFLRNHGLLQILDRPCWRVVKGGSARYVDKLTAEFRHRIRLNTPIEAVQRDPRTVRNGITVVPRQGDSEHFDRVVLAVHSDQALALLGDGADGREREVLGAFAYQPNEAVLHTDTRLLPRRRRAWASWNYHLTAGDAAEDRARSATLTYNMNILQGLDAPETFCVTLNERDAIDPSKVLERLQYAHPVYTPEAAAAQLRHDELNGPNHTYFCGAYWANGFHEDGVQSALRVGRCFGITLERALRGRLVTVQSLLDVGDELRGVA